MRILPVPLGAGMACWQNHVQYYFLCVCLFHDSMACLWLEHMCAINLVQGLHIKDVRQHKS